MSERLHELGHNTTVALVTFTDPANLSDYAARHELPFAVLRDPDRQAYRSYGLGRGSVARVWGPAAARRYLELVRADGPTGLARPIEDTLQLGGDFVISPTGILVYGYWGAGPDDRPAVDALIAAAGAAGSERSTDGEEP